MKIPRDLSGEKLINRLSKLGYKTTRQSGSHIRLTLTTDKVYHLTIPFHSSIKIGTLNSILNTVSNQLEISKEELIEKIK